MLRWFSSIAGSNEVKAKRATPTPTTNAKMPASKIAALLFRSNKCVDPYVLRMRQNVDACWQINRQSFNVKDSVNTKQLIICYRQYVEGK